jgi:L-lactate dehydrogenase
LTAPNLICIVGTVLDTSRLRFLPGEMLDVAAHSVHAYIIGEHDNLEVATWSAARIAVENERIFLRQRLNSILIFKIYLSAKIRETYAT